MKNKLLITLVTVAMVLALGVVMLGAYTRLTDAGLGCPDWPGCYGKLVLPSAPNELNQAQANYPGSPIEAGKAWTEMAHRYAAGTLATLILCIAVLALLRKTVPKTLPLVLVGLVIFQALLGMWTVTLKLLPVVVMSHLLGGIIIFACLCRYRVQLSTYQPIVNSKVHALMLVGFILLVIQIALGGWVSANYAGIACIGFPRCNGQWLPQLHFLQGFNLLSPVGANYQGGVLDSDARMTIQIIHRMGALVVGCYLGALSLFLLWRSSYSPVRLGALAVLLLLLTQISLGILNVVYLLPLPVAVLHNGVGALTLAAVFCLFALFTRRKKDVH